MFCLKEECTGAQTEHPQINITPDRLPPDIYFVRARGSNNADFFLQICERSSQISADFVGVKFRADGPKFA